MTALTILVVLAGLGVFAMIEWCEPHPAPWVVKVRLWLHRRKR